MALQLLPILKAMPGLISVTSSILQSIGTTRQSATRTDERTKKLEDHLMQTVAALGELAEKVEALALSVETQADALRIQTQRAKQALAVAWIASGVAVAALIVALIR